MRALRRVATPVAVILSGCSFPVDEFRVPAKSDVGLTTNQDVDVDENETSPPADARADVVVPTDASTDAGPDACVCVKQAGPNCKEWSPPDCGK